MKYPDKKLGGTISSQPSTWPEVPQDYNQEFGDDLRKIIQESLVTEIKNVINDAQSLDGRGHVVALSILCAVDTLSSYAFRDIKKEICLECGRGDNVGPKYKKYIEKYFPNDYKKYSKNIYKLYRNPITHSWNLFEAGMLPGNEPVKESEGNMCFGLLNFFNAFRVSVDAFFDELKSDFDLQKSVILRYSELRSTAK